MFVSWNLLNLSQRLNERCGVTREVGGETYYLVARSKSDPTLVSRFHIPAGLLVYKPLASPDEYTMARISRGLCQELKRRARPVGVMDVCLKSPVNICRNGSFELLVQFSPQISHDDAFRSIEDRVREVQRLFIEIADDVAEYCKEASELLRLQEERQESYTVFFLTERQAKTRHIGEDVVVVSSSHISKFMTMLIEHYTVWMLRQFRVGEECVQFSPDPALVLASIEKRAVTRQRHTTLGARVTTYVPTGDGHHCLLFNGMYLGIVKSTATAVLQESQIFTDEFNNKAISQIKARRLYDMGNRGVDIKFHHVYSRFAHGASKPLAALVVEASNLQRLSESCDRYQGDISSLVEENRLRSRPVSF